MKAVTCTKKKGIIVKETYAIKQFKCDNDKIMYINAVHVDAVLKGHIHQERM